LNSKNFFAWRFVLLNIEGLKELLKEPFSVSLWGGQFMAAFWYSPVGRGFLPRRLHFPVRAALFACLAAMSLCASAGRAQSWSPDGRQIAVGGPSLLLADAQTLGALVPAPPARAPGSAAMTPLVSASLPIAPLPNVGAAYAPGWARDGRVLAYLADGRQLAFYDLAKRQARTLDANAVSPAAWSRDSSLFAVVHKNEAGNLQALIRYRNGQTFLPAIDLPFHSVPSLYRPITFLTNTTNVIVAGGDGGKNDLYLLDQGDVVRLTSTGDVLGFAVSEDGTRLRWVRASPNTRYILLQIYEMTIDTRTIRKFSYPDRLPAVNPNPRSAPDAVMSVVFTPDMSRFAFVTRGGPQAGTNGSALWISDIAGQDVHFVGKGVSSGLPNASDTAPASATQLTGLTFPAFTPVFSPDSKSLAAVRAENGKRFLLVASAAAGQGKETPLP
jgi:WD40 repeat protein